MMEAQNGKIILYISERQIVHAEAPETNQLNPGHRTMCGIVNQDRYIHTSIMMLRPDDQTLMVNCPQCIKIILKARSYEPHIDFAL